LSPGKANRDCLSFRVEKDVSGREAFIMLGPA